MLPFPSLSLAVCSNSCPLSQWCDPTVSFSVACFSSYSQILPASGSFPMSRLFASGDQSIGASASASVLPLNIQDWFPLGLTGLISLLPKGLLGVISSTTIWKHQFFGSQPHLEFSLSNTKSKVGYMQDTLQQKRMMHPPVLTMTIVVRTNWVPRYARDLNDFFLNNMDTSLPLEIFSRSLEFDSIHSFINSFKQLFSKVYSMSDTMYNVHPM